MGRTLPDFMPDVIPALFYKLFNRTHHWIAVIYLLAPNPFKKETPLNARSIFCFWSQNISLLLMKYFADQICVLNKSDKEKLASEHKVTSSKIIITRPGVTVPNLSQQQKKYDACFVGRFHKQKGISDLLEIWKYVCKQSSDAKLALIGSGEKEWFDFIENYIKTHKLHNNIDALGFKDGKEKFQIMKSSKVFLFPSNYESFGIAGLEALAIGLPVVAYDIPVFKEMFHDIFSLIPFKDNKAFAQEVIKLIQHDEYYKQQQNKGLKFAQDFSWEKCAKNLFVAFDNKKQ
jgi:glycosyltransferase involved in cell wall biosynthesis